MTKRVVITGMGALTPVGNDVASFWSALCSGTSGIDKVRAFDTSKYPTQIAAELKDFDASKYLDAKEVRRTDRVILLAVGAADMAVKDSGLDLKTVDLDRVGTIIGSGIGGLKTLEDEHAKLLARGPDRVSPFLIPMMISDMCAGRVSMGYGFHGPNYAVVSACASGAHAIGDAFMMIKAGMMDVAVAGGSESTMTPVAFAGFCNMKAMSTRNDTPTKASSPFDKKRDGFVMGEGAGIVILESLEHALARNAKIYGELIGYGATGDAYHLSAPDPEGNGARKAMVMAMRTGNVTPSQIDYINAHGTSTPLNDRLESIAIAGALGEYAPKVAISSTKSMTGHLLGASGAIEFIATIMAVKDGIIPPTINLEDPDPECPLSYTPNKTVKKNLNHALSNSFGFGGHNACLLIKKYEAASGNA